MAAGTSITNKLQPLVKSSPDFAPAHWYLGEVRQGEHWLSIDSFSEEAKLDAKLAEYRERRTGKTDSPEDQLQLARWCHENGLPDEAQTHFTRVLETSPNHPEAMKALDLTEFRGTLRPQAQVDEQKEIDRNLAIQLKQWKPKVAAWKHSIELGKPDEREAAQAELCQLSDPAVIPALEATMPKQGRRFGLEVVDLLAKMPQNRATESLARYAVFAPSEDVRTAAAKQLSKRRLADYAPTLLSAMNTPLESDLTAEITANSLTYRHTIKGKGEILDQAQTAVINVPTGIPNPFYALFVSDAMNLAANNAGASEKQIKKSKPGHRETQQANLLRLGAIDRSRYSCRSA